MRRVQRCVRCFGLLSQVLRGVRWALGVGLVFVATNLRIWSAETPAPVFSAPGGVFTNMVNLTLSAPGAVVRYTLDGSAPDETSRAATLPFAITNSALVRARSFAPGNAPSETVSHSFTLLGEDLIDFNSNLPLLVVNAHQEEVSHDGRIDVTLRVIETSGGRASLLGKPGFDGRGILNIRGHSSQRYPKHSYTLRTIDEHDDKRKAAILGLAKENEWILYAPYPDKTLMRDVLAYELSNALGRWAPKTRYVELFYNESGGRLTMSNYVGVYVFEDRVSRSKHRVDIAPLGPGDNAEPEISGGYLIKKDHVGRGQRAKVPAERARLGATPPVQERIALPSGPGGFPADPAGFTNAATTSAREPQRKPPQMVRTRRGDQVEAVTNYVGFSARPDSGANNRRHYGDGEITADSDGFWTGLDGQHFFYVEPEPDELTAMQRAWLTKHFNQLESALYGPDFRDPQLGYAKFIEAGSFIDHHLLVEVSKNVDGFRFSTYYHLDRGGKMNLGPLWDLNLSFGNARSYECYRPEGWLWANLNNDGYSYFRRLFEDPDFAQRYVDRWTEMRANVFATSNVLGRVDRIAAQLEEGQRRNFVRWPILGEEIKPNYFVGTNYTAEITWMKDWIAGRLDWMERQFVAAPAARVNGSTPQRQLEFAPVAGAKIYYTLDGTDPRAPGGEPSARAKIYETSVPLAPGAHLFARAQSGARWSGPTRSTAL